jgi:hypothetical protein
MQMLSMREISILYAARGQAQVCVCIYETSVPEGGMALLAFRILHNMINILSSFIPLGTGPKLGATLDMSKCITYYGS